MDAGNDIASAKKEIRKRLLNIRKSIDKESRDGYDKSILEKIVSLEQYRKAAVILTYASYNGEADTYGIIERALKDGKKVACPVCELSTGEPLLDFYYISSRNDLREGYKGIPEPDTGSCVRTAKEDMDGALVIVPLVGYDDEGNRLGYGKGFYDRFLAANKSVYPVGIAYSCQRTEKLPVDRYDIKPGSILTELC